MSQPWLMLSLTITISALGFAAFVDAASVRKRFARAVWLGVAIVAIVVVARAIVDAGVRINFTASMPLGIYRLTPVPAAGVQRAMLVAVCAPLKTAELGRHRGYLSAGICSADTEPLLKTVVAVAGDDVVISACGVSVNGRPLVRSRPLPSDTAGRRLLPWRAGGYRLRHGQLWLYAGQERSWDSRYFGPVGMGNVLAQATPILTTARLLRSTSGEPSCGAARSATPRPRPAYRT